MPRSSQRSAQRADCGQWSLRDSGPDTSCGHAEFARPTDLHTMTLTNQTMPFPLPGTMRFSSYGLATQVFPTSGQVVVKQLAELILGCAQDRFMQTDSPFFSVADPTFITMALLTSAQDISDGDRNRATALINGDAVYYRWILAAKAPTSIYEMGFERVSQAQN